MRLKLIKTVNFQRTEAENLNAILKMHPDITLGHDDVVVMVSLSKTQLVFAYRTKEIDVSQYGARRGAAKVYHTERLRLDRSTFNPQMIQNYANEVGIMLEGFRRLEEQWASLKEKEHVVDLNAMRARREKQAAAKKQHRKLVAV